MADVAVITGGGSGIGFATAKFIPKDKIVILTGRTASKLEKAVAELEDLGYEAYLKTCDTSDRKSVHELSRFAALKGTVKTVINCAGMSPNMASGDKLLKVNAIGTVYINQEFYKVMDKGGVILDVASNSAYSLPGFVVKLARKHFPDAETDEEQFIKSMMKLAGMAKTDYQKAGFAYALSKNFVVWYAQKCAFEYGGRGIRVVSVSPGLIATDMGKLEEKEGSALIASAAEHRMGRPEELGFCIASIADERNGYLAGVDVLVDGGSINGRNFKR